MSGDGGAVQHCVPAAQITDGSPRGLLDDQGVAQPDTMAADGVGCSIGGHFGDAVSDGDVPAGLDAGDPALGLHGAAGDVDGAGAADADLRSARCLYGAAGDEDLAVVFLAPDPIIIARHGHGTAGDGDALFGYDTIPIALYGHCAAGDGK